MVEGLVYLIDEVIKNFIFVIVFWVVFFLGWLLVYIFINSGLEFVVVMLCIVVICVGCSCRNIWGSRVFNVFDVG